MNHANRALTAGGIAGVAITLAACVGPIGYGCADANAPHCDSKTVSEIASPQATYRAVVMQTLCAEQPLGNSVAIYVRQGSGKEEGSENLGTFSTHARFGSGNVAVQPPPAAAFRVEWQSDRELTIWYPPSTAYSCSPPAGELQLHCRERTDLEPRPKEHAGK